MEKIWKCKIGGEVGDLPAGADGPMRRAVQTAFKTLTGVEASFTFSGWGATLTEGERAAYENREPNWDAMQEAIGAGDGTLHGAIEYWHEEALRLRAELAACNENLAKANQQIETLENMLLRRFGSHMPGGCYVRYADYCECGWTQERLNIEAARKGEGV